jgi:hypothetical protein
MKMAWKYVLKSIVKIIRKLTALKYRLPSLFEVKVSTARGHKKNAKNEGNL